MNPICAVPNLVRAADHADVLVKLESGGVVPARRGAGSGNVEAAGDAEAHEFRNVNEHIDADIVRIEVLGARFRNLRPVHGSAEIAHRSIADHVSVAKHKRMNAESQLSVAQREQVIRVEV